MTYSGSYRSIPGVTKSSPTESEPLIRYVNAATGSDSNDGSSSINAWRNWTMATKFLRSVLDTRVIIKMDGDFSGDGTLTLEGVKTVGAGSLCVMGDFQAYVNTYAITGASLSPTDAVGSRYRIAVAPGGPWPANPEKYLIDLDDGVGLRCVGVLLDYDNINFLWIDVSCDNPPAVGTLRFLLPSTNARFDVVDCDGLYNNAPNIVFIGFQAATSAFDVHSCRGVSVLGIDASVASVNVSMSDAVSVGRCPYGTVPTNAETAAFYVFSSTGSTPVSQVQAGAVNGSVSLTQCRWVTVDGLSYGGYTASNCQDITLRTSLISGAGHIVNYCDRVREFSNVFFQSENFLDTDVSVSSPYFHQVWNNAWYSYGVPSINASGGRFAFDGNIVAISTDTILFQLKGCVARLLVGLAFSASCTLEAFLIEECVVFGNGTTNPSWMVPSIGQLALPLRTTFRFIKSKVNLDYLAKSATDFNPSPLFRALLSDIYIYQIAMDPGGAVDFGASGAFVLEESRMYMVAFTGQNAGVQDNATLLAGSVLKHPAGGPSPGANGIFIGAAGSVAPYPAATRNDIPPVPTGGEELCVLVR